MQSSHGSYGILMLDFRKCRESPRNRVYPEITSSENCWLGFVVLFSRLKHIWKFLKFAKGHDADGTSEPNIFSQMLLNKWCGLTWWKKICFLTNPNLVGSRSFLFREKNFFSLLETNQAGTLESIIFRISRFGGICDRSRVPCISRVSPQENHLFNYPKGGDMFVAL